LQIRWAQHQPVATSLDNEHDVWRRLIRADIPVEQSGIERDAQSRLGQRMVRANQMIGDVANGFRRILQSLGETECVERWLSTVRSRFTLSHGRRPAALHTPTMLSIGTASLWEHAATTALGRLAGWLDDTDWQHLRRPCLGRAASGAKDQQTLRFIAAGKLWAALTNDAEALEILQRRNVGADSLARALEIVANSVHEPFRI